MLLIGNACINEHEARTQMAIWVSSVCSGSGVMSMAVTAVDCAQGILAAPLIMGNDLRIMTLAYKKILQNRMAVDINQDPLGKAGIRISDFGEQEVWTRELFSGKFNQLQRYAVALLNKDAHHVDITVQFKDVAPLLQRAAVHDVWSQSLVGSFDMQ
jgi:hypothetical protein